MITRYGTFAIFLIKLVGDRNFPPFHTQTEADPVVVGVDVGGCVVGRCDIVGWSFPVGWGWGVAVRLGLERGKITEECIPKANLDQRYLNKIKAI